MNLEELKSKEPKSIDLVLDVALRALPKPEQPQPHTLAEEKVATASESAVEEASKIMQEAKEVDLKQPFAPKVYYEQVRQPQITTEAQAYEAEEQDKDILERVSSIGISSDLFNDSARCLAILIKCGLRDRRLGQACIAEADNLVRSLNVNDEDRASLVIEVAELLEESAKQLARTTEFTLREVDVEEGEFDEYCPSCASRL